jgi:transcriptional regulator with XRE-family HTH domain
MVVHLAQDVQPSSQYYWWSAYGHFEPGEDGFPHVGQVIRHYRKRCGMSIEDLAGKLGISVSRAYELEEIAALPKSLTRREALARILGIPALLLKLSSPESGYSLIASLDHMHPHTMQAYTDVLDLAWEAFYTSSAQRSARTVMYWQQHLLAAIDGARGISRDELKALYCRFLQLGSVIARDRRDHGEALREGSAAVELAFDLTNAELIAASLYRRAKIYVDRHEYDMAVKDAEAALPYAARSRDPLRCYVSVFLAETYSHLDPADRQLQRKSLLLLDDVGRTVRAKGTLDGDGSFAKVDLPGLYMIRGDVLRRHGSIEAAQDALLIVRDGLPPEFTRWRGNLLISESQLCCAENDVGGACDLALDALDIIEATRSSSNRAKIEQIYGSLAGKNHPRIRDLGERLGLR